MASDRDLMQRIARSPAQRAGYKQLVRELGLGGGRERRLLLEQLARMTARGTLIKADRDHWTLPAAAESRENLVAGRLDLHREGYGFVRPHTRSVTGDDDIFIPPSELHGAMQGDQVLVEMGPPRASGANAGRRHGRILRIITRRNPTVVGRFQYAHGRHMQGNSVVPFDARMTQPILIPFGLERPEMTAEGTPNRVLGEDVRHFEHDLAEGDLDGLVVDVEITDWPRPTRQARGRVIEILGHPDDFGVDVEIMIRKHHLPHVFPEAVLEEARGVARLDPVEAARRHDFRDLPIVTIDGETARDFDDAVLVRENQDGYELQVHIADVAEYVTAGSALDLEARLRGTSVYFPDRAVPMLPQELSTDICSLRPDVDRLVLSCVMQIDREGEVRSYEVLEGVIRSARRMTYTQVHAILSGDKSTRGEFHALVPEFERMYTLARILNRKRERRGSIDFDLPEPVIEFNELGMMESIVRSDRTWANRLIEEFMLSANECVASWLEGLGTPSLYRIHEKPEPRRVIEFEEIAASFGYSLGIGALPVKRVQFKSERREFRAHNQRHRGGTSRSGPRTHEIPQDIPVTPRMYQRLAEKIAGTPEERILAHLMLRSLKQARYSEKNEGHFALAAATYTHFTSPIRRYPDLIVHRIAKALLRSGVSGDSRAHTKAKHAPFPPIAEEELAAIAKESSDAERRAAEAERELMEWKKVKFMQERIGEDFAAMVMNPTRYGLFIELNELFIEGLVPIDSLSATSRDGDHYTFRENTREIIGIRTGKRYAVGDQIRVVLDRVDEVERRLQFSVLEEAEPARGNRPKTKKKRAANEPAMVQAGSAKAGKAGARRKGGKASTGKNRGKRG